MKNTLIWALLALVSTTTQAKGYGYSYFTVGQETVTYEESAGGLSSDIDISNPVINTGGLYFLSNRLDFSIDALATTSPSASTEYWYDGGVLEQTNKMEYLKTATNVHLHYKLSPYLRIVAGPSFTYQEYSRYGLNDVGNHENLYFYGSWEESTTDILFDLGIAIDDANLYRSDRLHFAAKALLGLPIYGETKNTQFPDATFSNKTVRFGLEGTASYMIYPGLHIGLNAAWTYQKRLESDLEDVTTRYCNTMVNGKCTEVIEDSAQAYLPEADITNFTLGLQILWSI